MTLTLPITLAIIQALLVEAGAQSFAIPLSAVLETLELDGESIQRSEGRELLNLRGEALPLRRLVDAFELDAPRASAKFAVVLGLGENKVGLLVDSLLGQHDAVIKPIRGPVQDLPGIAGATELGNGSAVLVLDVAGLVEGGLRRKEAA